MSIADFIAKHKITIGFVGTTVVLATAYGTCQISPVIVEEAPAPAVVEEEAVEETPEEAPIIEVSDEEQIEAEEEAAENQPVEE